MNAWIMTGGNGSDRQAAATSSVCIKIRPAAVLFGRLKPEEADATAFLFIMIPAADDGNGFFFNSIHQPVFFADAS